jgi:hypothetical protein
VSKLFDLECWFTEDQVCDFGASFDMVEICDICKTYVFYIKDLGILYVLKNVYELHSSKGTYPKNTCFAKTNGS